jgi:hypothetical protein
LNIVTTPLELSPIRECRDCHETKPVAKFKVTPAGRQSMVCMACATKKRNATVAAFKADLASDESSDKRIQYELWKNYKSSKSTAERIRCLEALVKLRPADQRSALDDAAVVASLMEATKRKKKSDAEKPTESE